MLSGNSSKKTPPFLLIMTAALCVFFGLMVIISGQTDVCAAGRSGINAKGSSGVNADGKSNIGAESNSSVDKADGSAAAPESSGLSATGGTYRRAL